MKTYNSYQNIDFNGSVVALGSFDGLHKAHMELINKTKEYAKDTKLASGVLLFDKIPAQFFLDNAKTIMTLEDKKELLSDLDFLYIQEFSKEFIELTPEEFVKYLIEKLNIKAVSVGFNYRFGKNASGDVNTLLQLSKKYGFTVIISDEYKIDGKTVSSTLIRSFIENGDINEANSFLGREFFMTGTVLNGYHLGRTLGFPTVNLDYDKNSIIPKFGVYHGSVEVLGEEYKAVINVGKRPTFEREDITIESFLLDFEGDLYNKKIKVKFKEYLRGEIKFQNAEKLTEQIEKDIKKVIKR